MHSCTSHAKLGIQHNISVKMAVLRERGNKKITCSLSCTSVTTGMSYATLTFSSICKQEQVIQRTKNSGNFINWYLWNVTLNDFILRRKSTIQGIQVSWQ